MIAQPLLSGLCLGCSYALFGLSLDLIYRTLGVIPLAFGALLLLGAQIALPAVASARAGLPWIAIPAAMLLSAGLAAICELALLRPLRRRDASMPVTLLAGLGLTVMLGSLTRLVVDSHIAIGAPDGLPGDPLAGGGLEFSRMTTVTLLATAGLVTALWLWLQHSADGRRLRAVAESPRNAALLGIAVETMQLRITLLAGGLAGAAGVLGALSALVTPAALTAGAMTPFATAAQPGLTATGVIDLSLLCKGLTVIVLGGLGNLPGAVLAGLCLGLAEAAAAVLVGPEARDLLWYAVLLGALWMRPQAAFALVDSRRR